MTDVTLAKSSAKLDALVQKLKPGTELAELASMAKRLHDEAVKANRRAMQVAKELRLPAGTIVLSPATGTYGVIGKDGLIDPATVKPLNPHVVEAVGGIFYTPSSDPPGCDGSGQSLIGPGYVAQKARSGREGLAAAIVDAQAQVQQGRLA